jgi:hypothetical protein
MVQVMLCTCIFCKHFQPLYTIRLYRFNSLATEAAATEFQSKCRLITVSRVSLKRTCFAGQAYEIPSKYSHRIISRCVHACVTQNPSGSQRNLRVKDARRIYESLRRVKADTFATLVSRLMRHGPPYCSTRRHSRESRWAIATDLPCKCNE